MPYKCAVPGCRSNHNFVPGTPSVQMFRFPDPPKLREKWREAINLPNFDPTHNTHVCIKHFAPDDIQWHKSWYQGPRYEQTNCPHSTPSYGKLKPGAVPSVFNVVPQFQIVVVSSHKQQVEFKPEMWEDKSGNIQEPLIKVKRPRGRPRKRTKEECITKENIHVNGNSTNGVSSSGIFSESVACCALACPNTSDTHVMNRMPKEPNLRQLWVQKIDRLAWIPDADSALCEIHFDSEVWDISAKGEKSLKPDAIPTLFLHGEAIKSWVTLDDSGKVKKLAVLNEENGDAEDEESCSEGEENQASDEQMTEDVFVKREALEPEIDMVEGNEEVVSRDGGVERNQFETIFCDTTFPDQQHSSDSKRIKQELESVGEGLENPLSPETIYVDDQSLSNQSDMIDEGGGDLKVNISNVKSLVGEEDDDNFYLGVSNSEDDSLPPYKDRTRMRRRSSSQLPMEFECPICERRLSRRKNLEVHIKKLHPNGELTGTQKRNKMLKEEEKSKKPVEQKQQQLYHIIASPPTPPLSKAVPVPPLLETPPLVTPPRPLDPSPAGGEMKKQYVLLVPNAVAEPSILPTAEGLTFSVNVASVPPEKRLALRIKLKELVDAVVHKNLNPERIIIAYDGT